MLLIRQILVRTIALSLGVLSLTGCGQQGPLYLPTEPAAARRATLPETLWSANTSASPNQSAASAQRPPASATQSTTP